MSIHVRNQIYQSYIDLRCPDECQRVQIQVDCKETPDAHIFKTDLPGLKKEVVKIAVLDGRILQISGVRGEEEEVEGEKYHYVERWRGSFQRHITLPENANLDEVKANMENGVLTVTVPKHPQPQPQLKTIEISEICD